MTQSKVTATASVGLGGVTSQGLAIFDLDRTLIPGSSLVPLGRALVRQGEISRGVILRHAVPAAMFRHRGLSEGRVERVQGALLSTLAGRDQQALVAVAREVGTTLGSEVYPAARRLIDLHLRAGDFCVVLTAAPHELAQGVADAVGAHRAIGTRLEVDAGCFTGRVAGVLCHGAGKLVRLAEEVGGVDWSHTTVYGDSASDLPVLRRAAIAVAINPDRQLRAAASEAGWQVLRFS